jgi:gamma-glutamyl-gamma-aminobutyrate hydrolase PuuD/predicted ATP-grasp superfamily ATP-dependent carboligase
MSAAKPQIVVTASQASLKRAQDRAAHASTHPGRAIVTYGRSLISLVIARSLHERGVEVIGCDDVGMTVLSFSRHVKDTFIHPSFEQDEAAALDALEEMVLKHAPTDDRPYVLVPSFRDARLFARHRDRFEPLIRIAAPDLSSIEMVDPKDAFARFCEAHRLPAPRTRILAPGDYRDAPPEDVALPLIAKPVDGVGGRGVERIETREELAEYLAAADRNAPLLLQEPVDGQDYCASFVAVRGELIGLVVYRNVRQFPIKSGAGAVRETVDPKPFEAATRALARITRWNGVAEIDFRWNGEAGVEPRMLEVNPRYWAGLFHSTASGVDFPWIAFRLAAGLSVDHADVVEAEPGFRTRTPGAWLLSAAQEVAASDPHLERAAEAWAKAKAHVSRGDVIRALGRLAETVAESAQGAKALGQLKEHIREHGDLPSELSPKDDPAVGLGVLFVLSSLMRHGELPPEVKFSAPEAEEKPAPRKAFARVRGRLRRPVIGVTKPEDRDWLSYQAMRLAIWLAGGKAVTITARAPRDPQSIDGLLFGGGADIFPKRFEGEPKAGYRYDVARDDMEASWADAALKHDIPILGVCRGMQMLNVLGGGTLHMDLSAFKTEYPTSFWRRIFYRKQVVIEPDSWLACATERLEARVNSIHSQAVDALGMGFVATAREENGLIQAIEHTRSAFLIGVQFHPEFLIHRRFARRIFETFVDAARERAARRFGVGLDAGVEPVRPAAAELESTGVAVQ